jgi:chemotaxis protein CheZ
MAIAKSKQLDQIADYLNKRRASDVTFADVVALAEIAAQSLRTFFATMDATVYKELRDIAGYIEAMKSEIGVLQANELKENRIPAAGQELSAIVDATEKATHTIMACAEAVMEADAADPAAYKALVDQKMTDIFEACSFQDITGQRIAKVVETLQHIEARVSRFANVMHAKDTAQYMTDKERARAERKQRLMLNGPQKDGEAVKQQDVDELLMLDSELE